MRFYCLCLVVMLIFPAGCKNKGAQIQDMVDELIRKPNDKLLLNRLTALATEGHEMQRHQTLSLLLKFAQSSPENIVKYVPIVKINLYDDNPLNRIYFRHFYYMSQFY